MLKSKVSNIVLIILSMLIVSAITVLATGAWFSYSLPSTGTITLKNGVSIAYTGLNGTTTKTLILTNAESCSRGDVIPIEQVTIRKPDQESGKTEYTDFFFRFKIKYEYSTDSGTTWVEALPSACYLETALSVVSCGTSTAGFKLSSQSYYYYFKNSNLEETSNLETVSSTAISLFNNYSSTSKPAVKLSSSIPENYKIRITLYVSAVQHTVAAADAESWCV